MRRGVLSSDSGGDAPFSREMENPGPVGRDIGSWPGTPLSWRNSVFVAEAPEATGASSSSQPECASAARIVKPSISL